LVGLLLFNRLPGRGLAGLNRLDLVVPIVTALLAPQKIPNAPTMHQPIASAACLSAIPTMINAITVAKNAWPLRPQYSKIAFTPKRLGRRAYIPKTCCAFSRAGSQAQR
jgi:hypothetical protein